VNAAPDPTDPLHRVMTALRDFGEGSDRAVDRAGRMAGLYRTDLRALNILMRRSAAGLETTASDLGRLLDLTKPAATAVVDRLVASGHAIRERSTQDRRRVLILHTDSAVRDGGAAFAPVGAAMHAALVGFTDEELETALEVIRAAADALRELESAPPAPGSDGHGADGSSADGRGADGPRA
jgi:DNA-binding MarR family transcriptional regulator